MFSNKKKIKIMNNLYLKYKYMNKNIYIYNISN